MKVELRGKNEEGWTKLKEGERSVRDSRHGLQGQEIWLTLRKLGFVHKDMGLAYGGKEQLTQWEQKLESWLIWGHWEELPRIKIGWSFRKYLIIEKIKYIISLWWLRKHFRFVWTYNYRQLNLWIFGKRIPIYKKHES